MVEIRFISARETWPLRWKVLKPFLGSAEEAANPGDEDETSIHLGAYHQGKLIGVATFYPESHPFFPDAKVPYRLRGMATDPEFRRQGAGRALVEAGENEIRKRSGDFLWFNAREVAFAFYSALGFQMVGDLFELPRIGPHKVMYKNLARR